MAKVKLLLTIGEKIDRSRDGRSQKWIVSKLVSSGIPMTEVQFTVKKKSNTFTEEELKKLGEILNTDFAD